MLQSLHCDASAIVQDYASTSLSLSQWTFSDCCGRNYFFPDYIVVLVPRPLQQTVRKSIVMLLTLDAQ